MASVTTLEASGRAYEFLEPVDDRASMDGAYNGALNLIEAHPDMDIIYSGDAFAEGVANAVNDMGLVDSIDVVGGDRADSLLQAIKDGNVMGTIAQDTFAEGFFGVVYMYVAAEGIVVAREGGAHRPAQHGNHEVLHGHSRDCGLLPGGLAGGFNPSPNPPSRCAVHPQRASPMLWRGGLRANFPLRRARISPLMGALRMPRLYQDSRDRIEHR